MENRKCLYLLIIGLVVLFAADKFALHYLKNTGQVAYMRFGEHVFVLPNSYYVDPVGNAEIAFRGEQGNIFYTREIPVDTLEYFERNLESKSEKCGMKLFDGNINGKKITLLLEGKMSLVFVDVPSEVKTAAFASLCEPRKAKFQSPM